MILPCVKFPSKLAATFIQTSIATMTNLIGIEIAVNKLIDPNEAVSIRRLISHNIRAIITLHTVMIFIAFRNVIHSTSMTIKYRYKFAPICCLVTSTCGVLYCILTLMYQWPIGLSCDYASVIVYVFFIVSDITHALYLVERAYVACRQSMLILVACALMILGRIIFSAFTMYYMDTKYDDLGMCLPIMPIYTYFTRFIFDFGFIAVFFTLFMQVTIQMYRRRRTNAWRKLAQNGITVMLLICTAHLLSFVCIALNFLGRMSSLFLVADW